MQKTPAGIKLSQLIDFDVKVQKGICFIKPDKRNLNYNDKRALEEFLLDDSRKEKIIALDLDRVARIDSCVLGLLLEANKFLNNIDSTFVVCNLNPDVYGVIQMTRIHYIINVRKDVNDVLESYS